MKKMLLPMIGLFVGIVLTNCECLDCIQKNLVQVFPESCTFSVGGGSKTITVKSVDPWIIDPSSVPSWLTIVVLSGGPGAVEMEIVCAPNITGQERSGTIKIISDNGTITPLVVKQEALMADAATLSMFAAGYETVIARKVDGTAWAWGWNGYGQLGDGTTTNQYTPVQVELLNNIIGMAGGYGHTVALKSDGTVWTWGINTDGELGDGTATSRITPAPIADFGDVISVAAGHAHALALKKNGTVWVWGYGGWGVGTTPVQVTALSDITALAATEHDAYALRSDGTVWTWRGGYPNAGSIPSQISNLSGIKAISGGYSHFLALKSDGTVWMWPGMEQVMGLNDVKAIGAGGDCCVALKSDGTIWNFEYWTMTPVQVFGLSNVTDVISGLSSSYALKSDGTIWAWGFNGNGELGDGTTTARPTPVQVVGPGGVGFFNVILP